jgi:hypothetical protein
MKQLSSNVAFLLGLSSFFLLLVFYSAAAD